MKLARLGLVLAFASLNVVACSQADKGSRKQSDSTTDGDDPVRDFTTNLLDETSSSTGSTEGEDTSGVVDTVIDLKMELDLAIATCAGFGDETQALQTELKELRESNTKPEDAKDELKPYFEAVAAKVKDSKDNIKSCIDEQSDSAQRKELDTIIESCWSKPEGKVAKGGEGDEGRKGPLGRGGPQKPRKDGQKGPKKRFRLPPRELSNFDSEACKAAVESAASDEEVTVEDATSAE